MNLAELSRIVANLIRIGSIEQIDYPARRVRVKCGDLSTNWLKWRVGRAGDTQEWDPPSIGEQVLIFSPSGEMANAVIMGSIYCDEFDSPSSNPSLHLTKYPDGAEVSYNHETGELKAVGIKTGLVEASEHITMDTPHVHILGSLTVTGMLTYMNGMTGSAGDADNSITITGNLHHEGGTLSSNGIVLHTHTHPGTGGPE